MKARTARLAALLFLLVPSPPAVAQPAVTRDSLARDVERLESLRAIKDLQRIYAHYAQFGLWNEVAALFAETGTFSSDKQTVRGRAAIADYLTRRGGGVQGLSGLAVHTELIDNPVVTLAPDGKSGKGRWNGFFMLADREGNARIEGGVFENVYVEEGGVWKIKDVHFHPQFAGSYEEGWTNWGGGDLGVVPYHFTVDQSGTPIPPPADSPPPARVDLAHIERRVEALNAEDQVRNLQNAYGYYVDRKMWDDVVDLFAADGVVEVAGVGIYTGKEGVRRALERMGPPGLAHGELNERPLFDLIVSVAPGAQEAFARGIELGMLGQADQGSAHWEISVFRNRFVKEGGLWKIREMRIYPLLKADYRTGWGKGRVPQARPTGRLAPDRPGAAYDPVAAIPAFLEPHPVTGRNVKLPPGKMLAATTALTPAIAPGRTLVQGDEQARLREAARRLAVSSAFDGTENVSSAYGFYIDDFLWPEMAGIFAEKGNKQSPFAGYYLGRDRILGAVNATWGAPVPTRPGISYHWRTQPVILVAPDGRSANLRTRLFQPRTGKKPAEPGDFYGAAMYSGMYPNDQTVLEDGIWRLWSVTIDEPYFTSAGWKGGWSAVKPVTSQTAPRPSPLLTKYPPDILLTELGVREEGFRGGTGKTIEWPGILPMWFNYRNLVSGRTPDRYWPDCVPCELRPDASMTRHGYLMPPTGPQPNGE
jgi:hypothetical protein